MGRRVWVLFPLLLVALGACTRPPPPVAPPAPQVVRVASPRVQPVTDYQDFTGRAKASDTVDIKARATGYLDQILFADGAAVKAGQPLFVLEPGTYETDLNRAKAVVAQAEVTLANRRRDYDRVFGLSSSTTQEKDNALAQQDAAKADLEVARKQQAMAQKLLDYTKLNSPKDGQIGRRLIDRGSLVKADETLLATVVTTDPIHVYFDVDDRTLLRLKRLRNDGKLRLTGDALPPTALPALQGAVGVAATGRPTVVQVGLPDQDGFPEPKDGGVTGVVTFLDTQLTATTGTITLRADVPNPKGLLTPNLFVRVRLPIGEAKASVLVPEEAIGTDQGLKFVYVVNAKDEVEYRPVAVGLQVGTEVVVEAVPGSKSPSGVTEGERVIVEGVQRVRRGMKVSVK
jgi:RND family efflux transporter MFP subunit